jgi:hypothetical protein
VTTSSLTLLGAIERGREKEEEEEEEEQKVEIREGGE